VEQSGYFLLIFSLLTEKQRMATFIGDYTCKVDVKGRIILPVAFKKQMPADAQDHFVVRKDIFDNCLALDNNNRLLIPRRLLDLIGAERDLVLAGQDGRIEIWAESVYNKIGMAPDDFADLAEKLMGGSINDPDK
jgi:MraZ protein